LASPRPQDNLYAHVNTEWHDRTALGTRQTMVSTFTSLQLAADASVRRLLAGGEIAEWGLATKVRAFRRSWLDADGAECDPFLDALRSRIGEITDGPAFFRWCGEAYRLGIVTPVRHYVDAAPGEPRRYRSHFAVPGLPFPVDVYLGASASASAGYRSAVAEVMRAAHGRDGAAGEVADLEAGLAGIHRAAPARTGAAAPYSATGLRRSHPALTDFLGGAGIVSAQDDLMYVEEPEKLSAITALLSGKSAETLRDYALWCALGSLAPYLSGPVAAAWTAVNDRIGTQKWLFRDRRGQGEYLISRAFGHALGDAYAAHHVDAAARDAARDVVRRVVAAYREALTKCEWLGTDARASLLDKLDRINVAFVAPDRPRDYGAVEILHDRFLANYRTLVAHEVARDVARIGSELSADHWWVTPTQVGAYYDARAHRIAIPAALLQEPLFQVGDLAGNLGGLGAVVAHELTHAFDDRNVRIGADGFAGSAWRDREERACAARNSVIVRQFGAFRRSDFPDIGVDGARTLNENIADLAGLSVAADAWTRHCREVRMHDDARNAGARDLFTNWARVWRQKAGRAAALALARTDPHSPGEARCNQVSRNLDTFHQAFAVGPDDRMWLDPAERIRIW
jgi:putative endopeptidase